MIIKSNFKGVIGLGTCLKSEFDLTIMILSKANNPF